MLDRRDDSFLIGDPRKLDFHSPTGPRATFHHSLFKSSREPDAVRASPPSGRRSAPIDILRDGRHVERGDG